MMYEMVRVSFLLHNLTRREVVIVIVVVDFGKVMRKRVLAPFVPLLVVFLVFIVPLVLSFQHFMHRHKQKFNIERKNFQLWGKKGNSGGKKGY